MDELKLYIELSFDEYSDILRSACEKTEYVCKKIFYYDTVDGSNNERGCLCYVECVDNKYMAYMIFRDQFGNEQYVFAPREVDGAFEQTTCFGELMLCQGQMVTNSTTVYASDVVKVTLDEDSYLGVNDYELSIILHATLSNQADRIANDILNELLNKNAINNKAELMSRIKMTKNKNEKFFERLLINGELYNSEVFSKYKLMLQ